MPGEAAAALNRIRPLNLEILRWKAATVAKNVQVDDKELAEAFAARASSLQVPEKRAVRYVLFALAPDQRTLEGAERVAEIESRRDDLLAAIKSGDRTKVDERMAKQRVISLMQVST
jgi:hypothetical protein